VNPVLVVRPAAGGAVPASPPPFPAAAPAAPLRIDSTARALPPPVAVLERTFTPARPAAPGPGEPAPAPPGGAGPSIPAALAGVEAARARIDGLLAEARRGRSFSPQELLCLQADAHRFAQSVELAARVVEHGVQGIRQALQAQV
jgi:hypothetical protein